MNNFKTFLSSLTKACDQVYGAVVMGFDGMPLSGHFERELPRSADVYEAIISEFSPIIRALAHKAYSLDLGEADIISMELGDALLMFKILSETYFLAIVAKKDAFKGKIEYYSKLQAAQFLETFDVS